MYQVRTVKELKYQRTYTPLGFYCDEPGMFVQKDCDQGYFCGEAANKKEPCPPGTYRDELNGTLTLT